jgi:hypothetical protein
LDAAKAWDLVFPDAESFNSWAGERYRRILDALHGAVNNLQDDFLSQAI